MYDPRTRESRGFDFVTMESVEEVEAAAITALNATELRLIVDVPVSPRREGIMGLRSVMTVNPFSILVFRVALAYSNITLAARYQKKPHRCNSKNEKGTTGNAFK
jgi:hypothetical protein